MEHFYHCKSPWINQHCERTPRPGPRQGWVCVSVWAPRLKGCYLHIFFMLWSRSTPLPPIPVPQHRDRYPPVPPSSPPIDHLFLGTFAFKMKSLFCFVFFVCLSFDKWMITWALGIDAIGRGRLSRQSVTASFHCQAIAACPGWLFQKSIYSPLPLKNKSPYSPQLPLLPRNIEFTRIVLLCCRLLDCTATLSTSDRRHFLKKTLCSQIPFCFFCFFGHKTNKLTTDSRTLKSPEEDKQKATASLAKEISMGATKAGASSGINGINTIIVL